MILGGLAGLTILLGLPVARLRLASRQYLSLLNAFAIGILLFLFVEVMEHAVEPVEEALEAGEPGFLLLLLIMGLGFAAGLLTLVYYAQRFMRGWRVGWTTGALDRSGHWASQFLRGSGHRQFGAGGRGGARPDAGRGLRAA